MTNKEAIKYLIVPVVISTKLSAENLKQKEAYELAIKALKERPHGKWIPLSECSNHGFYCSICWKKEYKDEYAIHKVRSNFYPNCGADMRGEEE